VGVRPPPSARTERVGEAEHGWDTFAGTGGVELFVQWWRPAWPAHGVVIVQHGLKDHGTRYAAFAERLVTAGYAVYAMDLRGHGRSGGRRVTVDSFDEYLDDFDAWVRRVKDNEPGRPMFLFGHSMGGVIVTLAAMDRQANVAGIITSAPALEVDVPPIVLAGGDVLSVALPNVGALGRRAR
jgi:alpha-beta hydrolase superfamily lysophospholipase